MTLFGGGLYCLKVHGENSDKNNLTQKGLKNVEYIFKRYLGLLYCTWKNDSTKLLVRNFARPRRRRHIPAFGRFCPKIIFCRKFRNVVFSDRNVPPILSPGVLVSLACPASVHVKSIIVLKHFVLKTF